MKTLLIISFLCASLPLIAQEKCPCCDANHQQFAFWEGDWEVTDSTGKQLGENHISIEEAGCIMIEHWKGAKGSTGTSMNYYDPSDNTWNQVWVDNSGGVLKLKGNLNEGSMVLKSELVPGKKIDFYYNQVTWTPREDGSVTQLWEVYDKNGKLLQTAFDGIYKRKAGSQSSGR